MFVKITENGIETYYTISELKKCNPNVFFPENITDEMLKSINIHRVKKKNPPQYNPMKQTIKLGNVVEIDGEWVQEWEVIDYSFHEKLEIAKNARAEAYKTQSDHLFFKAQRGEIEMKDWENAVNKIRKMYPYPE